MVGTVLEQYVNKLDIQGVPKKMSVLTTISGKNGHFLQRPV